jgi:hypothetical protein
MGQAIFAAIALLFAIQIFRLKGVKKLPWFFGGILFFTSGIVLINTPSMPFPRFMTYLLLIVTIIQQKGMYSEFKNFPLKVPLIILLIAFLLIGLFDSRLNYFLTFYRPITYFLENFFIVFLTFVYIKTEKDALKIYDFLIKIFILMALYGFSNYITKQNEYNAYISTVYNTRNFANDYMITGIQRFRISSFTFHAIFYGFLLNIILLMEIFMFTGTDMKKKKVLYSIIAGMLVINLMLVNSRTPLFSLFAGASVYVLFAINFTKKIVIIVASVVVGFAAIAILPNSKIIDKTVAIMTGRPSEKEDGSSLQMRQEQLDASVRVFNQNPVFGNGFDYITENLGFSSDVNKHTSNKEFRGFESYYFTLLIEQGLCGIIADIIFFTVAITWLIRQYFKVNQFGRKVVVFTAAIIVSFLIFILGTGDLGSFPFFMGVFGINLKLITLCNDSNSVYVVLETTEIR